MALIMFRYLKVQEIFQEIPGEISLGISISGCIIHCKGCNQRDLWEDKGIILDIPELDRLLEFHKGVTCLLLLGGERDLDTLTTLFMHTHSKIKTAWYCGLDNIPKDKLGILQYLDFCKIGHYDPDLGGLNSPTTNQRLFEYSRFFSDCTVPFGMGWRDITYKFWHNETNANQG